ncbi:MAG TPA: NCS1 family nucleobase:cation symporter-1 [Candidatus Baltobacteraceae bacterium]|nr:NCS1 family nucleobase:cation symporter-1 [Candidatus Baltobacteraceae bacterium]
MTATQERIGDVVVLTPSAVTQLETNHAMWNDDLRPCTLAEHNWPGSKFASLWIGMCLCLPTYSLASGMIALGMNWWEAVLTVLTGCIVVMVAILLVSHAGTKFGIPYPVFARLWFGTRGAHVPALARAVIAAGWFGINSWFGGQALDAILQHVLPGWVAVGPHVLVAFFIFWAMNVAIAMRGPQAIGRLAQIAAPTLAICASLLFVWGMHAAGGVAPMLSGAATIHGPAFWMVFYPSVVGVIAFWATMALNIPDYTRYAISQRGQMLGQVWSMPVAMALFAFIGITVTSVTKTVFGTALWNPIDLILKFPPLVVVLGGVVVILASVTINVGANVMAPARAFQNLWPRKITFAIGAIVTGFLSLLMFPGEVLKDFGNYIFVWLGTYGAMLGSFDGIAIADYWLVRHRRLDLAQLYRPDGMYAYAGGFNVRAVIALLVGWALALLGLVVPALRFLWSGGWLFSLLGGLVAYAFLMRNDSSVISATEYETITQEGASPGSA